jgi:hypothetical protein
MRCAYPFYDIRRRPGGCAALIHPTRPKRVQCGSRDRRVELKLADRLAGERRRLQSVDPGPLGFRDDRYRRTIERDRAIEVAPTADAA